MSAITILRLAVCLYPGVDTLDFQGTLEILSFISSKNPVRAVLGESLPPIAIEPEFLSHSLEPVQPNCGPHLLPSRTYDDVKEGDQYDILLIPGAADPVVYDSLLGFMKRQGPGAKYILAVCTGSWVLARSGLLNGKRATTNKYSFKRVVEATKDMGITWVSKARWVVNDDKKIWTSSGVTAGMDQANAFLQHLVGEEIAKQIRGFIELSVKKEGDDEFAEFYGLTD